MNLEFIKVSPVILVCSKNKTIMLLPGIIIRCYGMTQLSIIFLGTGGSWPTVKRNVASVAIKRGGEVVMFDCGEGTQRQIQKSQLSYMQISKIFITHFHGDHFLGLPGLIQTMQLNDREKPLEIYGPRGLTSLVSQLLSLGYFKPAFKIVVHELVNGDIVEFSGYTVRVLKVDHNVSALAYCFEEAMRPGKFNKKHAVELGIPEGPLFSQLQHGKSITLDNGRKITPDMVLGPPRLGRKIVVSGDTRPIKTMIDFAKGADVLVHDATFDSGLEDVAYDYGHATSKQAAYIADKAQVGTLFLTHISPRYLDPRLLETDARTVFQNSFVPKDLQEVEVKVKK